MQYDNLSLEESYLQKMRGTLNQLFPPEISVARAKAGMWTVGNIPKGLKRHRKLPEEEYTLFSGEKH